MADPDPNYYLFNSTSNQLFDEFLRDLNRAPDLRSIALPDDIYSDDNPLNDSVRNYHQIGTRPPIHTNLSSFTLRQNTRQFLALKGYYSQLSLEQCKIPFWPQGLYTKKLILHACRMPATLACNFTHLSIEHNGNIVQTFKLTGYIKTLHCNLYVHLDISELKIHNIQLNGILSIIWPKKNRIESLSILATPELSYLNFPVFPRLTVLHLSFEREPFPIAYLTPHYFPNLEDLLARYIDIANWNPNVFPRLKNLDIRDCEIPISWLCNPVMQTVVHFTLVSSILIIGPKDVMPSCTFPKMNSLTVKYSISDNRFMFNPSSWPSLTSLDFCNYFVNMEWIHKNKDIFLQLKSLTISNYGTKDLVNKLPRMPNLEKLNPLDGFYISQEESLMNLFPKLTSFYLKGYIGPTDFILPYSVENVGFKLKDHVFVQAMERNRKVNRLTENMIRLTNVYKYNEPIVCNSALDDLPNEVLTIILGHMIPRDIMSVAWTCRLLYWLAYTSLVSELATGNPDCRAIFHGIK